MRDWKVLLTRCITKSCFQALDWPSWRRIDSASSGIMNTVVDAFWSMVDVVFVEILFSGMQW